METINLGLLITLATSIVSSNTITSTSSGITVQHNLYCPSKTIFLYAAYYSSSEKRLPDTELEELYRNCSYVERCNFKTELKDESIIKYICEDTNLHFLPDVKENGLKIESEKSLFYYDGIRYQETGQGFMCVIKPQNKMNLYANWIKIQETSRTVLEIVVFGDSTIYQAGTSIYRNTTRVKSSVTLKLLPDPSQHDQISLGFTTSDETQLDVNCSIFEIPGTVTMSTMNRSTVQLHTVITSDRSTVPLHTVITSDRSTEPPHTVITSDRSTLPPHTVITSDRSTVPPHTVITSDRSTEQLNTVITSDRSTIPPHTVITSGRYIVPPHTVITSDRSTVPPHTVITYDRSTEQLNTVTTSDSEDSEIRSPSTNTIIIIVCVVVVAIIVIIIVVVCIIYRKRKTFIARREERGVKLTKAVSEANNYSNIPKVNNKQRELHNYDYATSADVTKPQNTFNNTSSDDVTNACVSGDGKKIINMKQLESRVKSSGYSEPIDSVKPIKISSKPGDYDEPCNERECFTSKCLQNEAMLQNYPKSGENAYSHVVGNQSEDNYDHFDRVKDNNSRLPDGNYSHIPIKGLQEDNYNTISNILSEEITPNPNYDHIN